MGEPAQQASLPDSPPPRERPWLLPYNRKLRHLQGITIRNLTLTATPSRSRGKTIDDDAIPSTLKSPTKALAMRESKGLAHSRSSSHLKLADSPEKKGHASLREPAITPPSAKTSMPTFGKGRGRRATMEWSNASPLSRQRKLEDITAGRMADAFFTLHIEGHDQPIYISEVAEKAMNPNFKFFDLGPCGPSVTRLDRLTVKLWTKSEKHQDWQHLMDYTIHFASLQFIGKTLGNFRHPLPPNCILFHMTDGIYTSFADLPVLETLRPELLAPPKQHPEGRVLSSSWYDALMRLSTLDDCIQDALVTRDRIADEIESIIEGNKEAIDTVEQVPEVEEKLRTVQAAVDLETRRVNAMGKKRDELKASIEVRRERMQAGREQQSDVDAGLGEEYEKHKEMREVVERLEDDINGQRRRVCEDLAKLYPIEPVAGKSLAFTIRGLLLPNSEFDEAKDDVTAAALNHVAQVVSQLSRYLSVALPYPITVHGSTSTMDDPLAVGHSNQNNPRTYPLYMKGVVRYRFEYGVFLLNKNVEILSNELGLRPMDIRHTLANLKYLLYIATAGKGELPARKAGGIRGLLRQDGMGMGSRKGSMDSTATASSASTRNIVEVKKKVDGGGGGGSSSSSNNNKSAGARRRVTTKANGVAAAQSAMVSLAHAGSRLRRVE